MSESFKCARCAKCCQTYWITLLPEEAKGLSKFLKVSSEKFLKEDCVLFLQAFPMQKRDFSNPLVISRKKFSGKIGARLSRKSSANFFLCLPSIALRREKKNCIMLSKRLDCKVHSKRPGQCRLFPLISLDSKTGLKKAYSFCKGLKGIESIDLRENLKHYRKVKAYFEGVKKKGFQKAWKQFPGKGVLLLGKEKICGISQKEFFRLFGP